MGVSAIDPLIQMSLPPGFRFFPTDEELLVQYLRRKVAGQTFNLQIMAEIDLYKFDPWVLPSKAIFGEREWYFFSPRDRKYPNGSRPNRVAGTGYWKATGTDKNIFTDGRKVGIKKALVFFVGKARRGTKTNWIMHEYRLLDSSRKIGSSKLDDWVLCRIYEKTSGKSQNQITPSISGKERRNSSSSSSPSSKFDDLVESLTEIDDRLLSLQDDQKLKFQNLAGGNFDSLPELAPPFDQTHPVAQGMMNYRYNDINIPASIPQLLHGEFLQVNFAGNLVEHEVQSGFITQRFDNSVLNSSLSSVDSYGYGYPTHDREFGLMTQEGKNYGDCVNIWDYFVKGII